MRILYIDIDSLRPDHLGCYGYNRPTSPNIDRIAAQGVRFNHFYCSDSPCVPSRAACFSGRPGIQNGVVAHENTPLGSTMRYGNRERNGFAPLWMHHLIKHGYETISFTSFANRHLAAWFHFGFRQFNLSSLKNGNEDAPEVNAIALPWFERNAGKEDWFVHLNYWDPHTLYTEPPEYARKMAEFPAPAWPDEATIATQQSLTGIHTPGDFWTLDAGRSSVPTMPDAITNRADFEQLINGYDGGINFVDEQLQLILDELERQGVLQETAIIISADHGEAFGELGQYAEHGSASPATNQIPLIIKWPGLTDGVMGSQCDEFLLNFDLAPTVCDALGLSLPSGWSGKSFASALRGETLEAPRQHLVWSHGLHTRQRAVFDGRWLFIRTYHPSYYLYEPRMLFDLQSDPHQTRDLLADQPDKARELEAILSDWEHENVTTTGQSDAMRDVQIQPTFHLASPHRYLEHLRSRGREVAARKLEMQWQRIEGEYAPQPLQ